MVKIKIQCDLCSKSYYLAPKQKYDLDSSGFSIYCQDCAGKLKLEKRKALNMGIKIYKM